MIKRVIKLGSASNARDFINIASKYSFEMDLGNGMQSVDAKSLLGVFNLDLSKPIDLVINASETECSGLLTELSRFM